MAKFHVPSSRALIARMFRLLGEQVADMERRHGLAPPAPDRRATAARRRRRRRKPGAPTAPS